MTNLISFSFTGAEVNSLLPRINGQTKVQRREAASIIFHDYSAAIICALADNWFEKPAKRWQYGDVNNDDYNVLKLDKENNTLTYYDWQTDKIIIVINFVQ